MQLVEELKALSERQYVSPAWFVWIFIELGELETALDYAEQAYEERDSILLWLPTWPRPEAPAEAVARHDAFYSSPRLLALKKKMGLD